MKVKDFAARLRLTHVCGSPENEVCGAYAGDLLSWVMSHAESGDVWITIMSNINVAAVASLTECACVIMAEGVVPDEGVASVAEEKGVCIYSDKRSVYELCRDVSRCLEE